MTKAKKVATTLKNVLDNTVMQGIMDRGSKILPLIEEVKSFWNYDLFKRSPGPAYRDGVFVGTDLDLACFLYSLAERNAVINIPKYESIRATSRKEGQMIVSKDNRHGQLLGVVSNKDVFSFSIKIKDMNVMSSDEVGDYRNFSITDLDGDWYSGWSTIQFMPDAKENAFLFENELLSGGNRIVFKNFVHPNRWTSFYGKYYFMTKALIERMREQAKDLNLQIKAMLNAGIEYPATGEGAQTSWPKSHKEEGKSVKFESLQVEVDIPDNDTTFPTYLQTQANLVEITKLRKDLTYKYTPMMQFMTRATELAFFKHGTNGDDQERMPGWLTDVNWEREYKLKGKKIKWDRLILFQPGVGERAVSIRKRKYQKAQIVSKDY
ncbi:hypothetical protein KAR91_82240 [Candidatus Pacearchaeota archaeon]|nr:hypothetical protein [Candidatus Pacearchaeota archaeon]